MKISPRRASERRLRTWVGTALLGALISLAGLAPSSSRPAWAQERNPKAAAKAEVEKAQLHYKLGRFDEALASYTRAYETYNAPALLFNIGQCHKNLKNYDRAIFFFEGYLREEANPEKRALTQELIAMSRAELQRQRYEPPVSAGEAASAAKAEGGTGAISVAPPPSPSPPPPPTLVDSPRADTSPVAAADRPPPPPAAPPPITKRWWFWTAIGAGVFAVAGGGLAYYLTGDPTVVPPSGSVGTLDRRSSP